MSYKCLSIVTVILCALILTSCAQQNSALQEALNIANSISNNQQTVIYENSDTITAPVYKAGAVKKSSTLFYASLSADDQYLYDIILQAIRQQTEEINFGDLVYNSENIQTIISLVYCQEPFTDQICTGYALDGRDSTSHIYFKYNNNLSLYTKMIEKTSYVTDQMVIDSVNLSDYEKIKYAHDYITKNCTYDITGTQHRNAYGVLVEGRGSCEGYAHAFLLYCSKVGIPCAVIAGYANEPHLWNVVQLDGVWYYIDLTWDDADQSDIPNLIIYDYFLVNASKMQNRLLYYDEATIPVSPDVTNPFYDKKDGVCITETSDIVYELKQQYKKACESKAAAVYVSFSSTDVYSAQMASLIAEHKLLDIQKEAKSEYNLSFNARSMKYIANPTTETLVIILAYEE